MTAEDDCPLAVRLQMRNVYCSAGLWCLIYLSAPVSYVGVTHANLLNGLGTPDKIANLPHAAYQWMTAFPVLVACFFPQPRLLKPLIMGALTIKMLATVMVAAALWLKFSAPVVTGTVIAFGALFGASNGVLVTALWEVVRRGISTSRRGTMMALSFGAGPLLACVGSIAQQCLLSKEPLTGFSFDLPFPDSYLALFASAVPVMVLSVVLGSLFIVPIGADEVVPSARLTDIVAGLRDFFTYRPLLLAAVGYLLVASGGNAVFETVSLHTKDVLGDKAADTVGIQNFLRFGFKAVTGVLLGWLLTKTNPKATLLATTSILLFALGWVLNSSGWWYLASAGLLGAGELYGAYFPNYVATASAKHKVRLHIAYLGLLGSLVGFASYFFGVISDRFGRIATFYTATGILVVAILLIIIALPARPVPREESALDTAT